MSEKLILVVDDEPAVLEALGHLVAHIGHRYDVAGSGAEALSKLEAQPYDVVLTDARMPGMDGYTFARVAKSSHPSIPIVLMSGSPTARVAPEISLRLQKPFSLRELRNAISIVTGGTEPHGPRTS